MARVRGTRRSPPVAPATADKDVSGSSGRDGVAPGRSDDQPQSPPTPRPAPPRGSQPQRQCADRWPAELCACDAHLTAFGQRQLVRDVTAVLDEAAVAVEDLGSTSTDLAVDEADMSRLESLLVAAGLTLETETYEVNPTHYDFPILRDGGADLVAALPAKSRFLHVVPPYACPGRQRNARQFGVRISAFSTVGGMRCYHSPHAPTRARPTRSNRHRARVTTTEPADKGIDIVFTTVDGADPAWRRRYRAATSQDEASVVLAKTNNVARYRSHGELRYALRSIYYYAPFVRRIHIVTDDQCPAWLDASHPLINVVDHAEIIDDQYRPTFNSDAIESFLWRIPGITERFLYFNDDVMLMAATSVSHFFTENNLPRFFPSRRLPDISADQATAYTLHAHLRTAAALTDRGHPPANRKFKHAPFACVRSVLEGMEEEFAEELAVTRRSRVRSAAGYATISFLYPHFALATQAGVIAGLPYSYVELSSDGWEDQLLTACRRTDLRSMCVNESDDAPEGVGERMTSILAARFPALPPWER